MRFAPHASPYTARGGAADPRAGEVAWEYVRRYVRHGKGAATGDPNVTLVATFMRS